MTDERSKHLLRRGDIDAMPGTSKVHFLNPNARRINKSLGDATGLTGIGVHLIEVPAGADSTELHAHHQEDECVYVLEGQGILSLDDARFEVGPGDFVGLPAGGPAHALHNPGPATLRCLVIGQRLAHDVADYPALGKRLFRHDGTWSLVNLSDVIDVKRASPGAGSK